MITTLPRTAAASRWELVEAPLPTADAASSDALIDKNFVYHEIRAKLAVAGIPPHEVAFIQEHSTPARRAALFAALNRGDVRVLIASKQTTGMNIQRRLIALHHLDAPWRPGDVEQREGRILRQGNSWPEVFVLPYVTEGSFDGYIWQTLETKAKFIQQMRAGDVTIREIDDISEVVLSAAEMKAIASGNPAIIQKVQLEAELHKLESLEASHRDTQLRMRRGLRDITYARQDLATRRTIGERALAITGPFLGTDFRVMLRAHVTADKHVRHTRRDAAGKALRQLVAEANALAPVQQARLETSLGTYRGLTLYVRVAPFEDDPAVVLVLDAMDGAQPLPGGWLRFESDLGVFASADAVIRGLPGELERIAQRARELDAEEQKIEANLAQPWEYAERYHAVLAELEQLDAALTRGAQAEPAATDSAPPDEAPPQDHVCRSARTPLPLLQMVRSDVAWTPVMPPVVLAAPTDAAAMAVALEHLALERPDTRSAQPAVPSGLLDDLDAAGLPSGFATGVADVANSSGGVAPEVVPEADGWDLPWEVIAVAPVTPSRRGRSPRSTAALPLPAPATAPEAEQVQQLAWAF